MENWTFDGEMFLLVKNMLIQIPGGLFSFSDAINLRPASPGCMDSRCVMLEEEIFENDCVFQPCCVASSYFPIEARTYSSRSVASSIITEGSKYSWPNTFKSEQSSPVSLLATWWQKLECLKNDCLFGAKKIHLL